MRITFGEHDDFAGFDRDRLSATDRGEAPPLGNDVIGDEMLRAREDLRQDPLPRRRLDGPWRLGHDVKKRGAGQSHRSQHIGKNVCSHCLLATVKERQHAAWGSGDYARIGTTLQIVGETLCEAADVRSNHRGRCLRR